MQTLLSVQRRMATPKVRKLFLRRRAILKGRKTLLQLSGGPLKSAYLQTPGTLCFSLGAWRGFYNSENQWVQL